MHQETTLLSTDEIMEKIQEFASTWSVAGGRFDEGTALDRAEACKEEIRGMLDRYGQPTLSLLGRMRDHLCTLTLEDADQAGAVALIAEADALLVGQPVAWVQPWHQELAELLRAIRPKYGAVGSRDADVAAQQKRIDRAIELLVTPAADPARPALPRYDDSGIERDEQDPLERLRFFCSLAMSGQDWLDVGPFFDAVRGVRAVQVEAVQADGLDFRIEDRAGSRILVRDDDSCRPATAQECALWDALVSRSLVAGSAPVAWMVPSIESFKGVESTDCPPDLQEKLEGEVMWSPSIIGDMPPVTDKHGVIHRPRALVYQGAVQAQSDQSLLYETALAELIDKIIPGQDSGDILADARLASEVLAQPCAPDLDAASSGKEGV